MGFLSSILGGVTGAADPADIDTSQYFEDYARATEGAGDIMGRAAVDAGGKQIVEGRWAREELNRARNTARQQTAKFRETGRSAFGKASGMQSRLQRLVESPVQQRDFIEKNPFFDSLADNAQSRLFSNQAARGKIGSGGTAEALQNSILLLGNDLLSQDVQRKQSVINSHMQSAGLGLNAVNSYVGANNALRMARAANQQDMGNVRAARVMGKAGATAGAMRDAAGIRLQGGQQQALNAMQQARQKSSGIGGLLGLGMKGLGLASKLGAFGPVGAAASTLGPVAFGSAGPAGALGGPGSISSGITSFQLG